MPDWDMNGDTMRQGYEAHIADLLADLDTAKCNTAAACALNADLRAALAAREAEVALLREALEPFAAAADHADDFQVRDYERFVFEVKILRDARAARRVTAPNPAMEKTP